jgi:GH24 family phage-related lysozyme (muramidase)
MVKWLTIACQFVRAREECILTAYPDPISHGDPWTIGDGCTGPGIVEGTVWTQEQADFALETRLTAIGDAILKASKYPLNDNQLAALCDFAWNEGLDALFDKSTLWRLWQSGRSFVVVAEYFEEWDIACGRVVQGLENRRILEKNLFLSPVVSA